MSNRRVLWPVLIAAVVFAACNRNESPKPHAYFRIDFPEKTYRPYTGPCPVSFDYPSYGTLVPASPADGSCMFNINFPAYRGTIYLTHMYIRHNLDRMLDDDWTFVYKKIAQKADGVDSKTYANVAAKVYATVYDIRGNAASPVQFFVTDSVSHFLRGSLYFSVRPNSDSIAPVVKFFRTDIERMIESLRWRNQ